MICLPLQQGRARHGFTLVELLVVIMILSVLAAISVMFLPVLDNQQRAADGAVQLQGWLNIAKQRAVRDGVPTGLRLYPTPYPPPPAVATCVVVNEAQYIQQPDDFTGGYLTATAPLSPPVPPFTITITGVDLYGGMGTGTVPGANAALWPVQVGDYVEIFSVGQVFSIAPPQPPSPTSITQTAPTTFSVQLNSPVPYQVNTISTTTNSNYRIIRAPRVVGEEKLLMPNNIGIDLTTNNPATGAPPGYSGSAGVNTTFTSNPDGTIDILFSPSGNVMGGFTSSQQAALNQLIFWVRDYTQTPPYTAPYQLQGEPTLVVVFTRSGMVAATQVDPSNGFQPGTATPYTFALNP